MLDEKDLQAIAQLMDQQKKEFLEESTANMRTALEQYVDPKFSSFSTELAGVRDQVVKLAISQENIVEPQLRALAEGQQVLLQKLAPRDRVEQLEDEISVLKSAIRALSQDVAELKKAQ